MNEDDETLEEWCKEEEIDYHLADKLKAKIFPLLEEAHLKLGYRFNKAFIEQRRGTQIRLDNSKRILLLMRKLKPQFFSIKERSAISLHFEYLTLVEGLFATQINFLIFTLIANGHDFNGVKTLSDIERVSLASRLKFLRKHKFGKLISDKVDVELRNSIAHLFYEIDEKGNVKTGKGTVTQRQYSELYDDLRNVSYGLHLINLLYYRRFA